MYYLIHDPFDDDYLYYCDGPSAFLTNWEVNPFDINHRVTAPCSETTIEEFINPYKQQYPDHKFVIEETYDSPESFKQQFPELFI